MKIAVIRFSALGDVANALPFLRALKVRPVIITSAVGRELLKDEFDEFLILKSKRIRDVLALISAIRKERFNMLIDLQNNDRSRIIDSLSGVKRTFTNRGIPRDIPAYENRMLTLQPTGLLGELDTAFVPKPREYIVLNTGSSPRWKSKRLPDHKWQEFAQLLLERYNLPFVLTGSPDETDYVATLAEKLPGEIQNKTGKTSLQELKKLIAGAFLTVSTDSAAMHISAAMKTPTIGLFGATNWMRYAPIGSWTTVLYDRTFYHDNQPPSLNRQEPGAYYEQIDLSEGLTKLTPFLSEPII